MLLNQTNNNGGQVPKLAKIYKDVHFNPNTNRWIHYEDEATYTNTNTMYVYHEDEVTYVCVSFHPYHVCKAIIYVVLML